MPRATRSICTTGWRAGSTTASELFFDGQHIDSGQHFPQRLAQVLGDASVVLVLIGPGWLDEINRRTALPELDFVRHEVEVALGRLQAGQPVRVIPVLLGGAPMPSAGGFVAPVRDTLGALCSLDAHAFAGSKQDDWEHQLQRLRRLIAAVPHAPRERYRDRSGQSRPWRVIEHALSPHFQDPNDLLGALRLQLQGNNGAAGGPAAFAGAGGVAAAVLHGMGGIGKTQLALAYCHRWRDSYAGIWWLRAETAAGVHGSGDAGTAAAAPVGSVPAPTPRDTLLQQDALAACAAAGVVVPEGIPPSKVLVQWLRGQSAPWLLVFDNADDPARLRQHLPGPGPHHVIVTSRRPGWGSMARALELHTWTAQQGSVFLQQRLGEVVAPHADAEALSQALGGLPLALEQAASYTEATGGSVAGYRRLWQTAAAALLQRMNISTGYEHTVGATLSLAFPRLSSAAQQLLRLCAFAAPEPLPERFFAEGASHLPAELAAAAVNPLVWNDVAGELKRYALAQRDAIPSLDRAWLAGGRAPEGTPTELGLTLHRLTQQVVRAQLVDERADSKALLELLNKACPSDAQHPAQWPRLAALLPHAVWVNAGDGGSNDEPARARPRTRLLDRMATFVQFGQALLPQARALCAQALAARHRMLGGEHTDTLTSMSNLAHLLWAQGDLPGARTLEEQVLAVRRRVLGDDDPDTLIAVNNLAESLRSQGNLLGARSLLEQALNVSHRVLGDEHPDTLTSINNLATTLWALGDLERARSLQEQALAAWRRVLGDEHPATLTSMNNLAETLRAQGDLPGACILEEQVLTVRRRVLGEEHPATLTSMGNLAHTLWAKGDLPGARSLEEQALAVRRRVQGDEHPETLMSMSNLADTLRAQGDLSGARSLQEHTLAVRRRVLGDEHPDTLSSINNLAVNLWHQGEHGNAITLMTQAADLRTATLGAEHPHAQQSVQSLAQMKEAFG